MATWDTTFEATPADSDDISQGASKIRETRNEARLRGDHEHNWGPGATNDDGQHLSGSAVAFVRDGATGPTKLSAIGDAVPTIVDGTGAALAAADEGRLWINEGNQLLHWDGTGWVLVNNIDPTATTGTHQQGVTTVATSVSTSLTYLEITSGVDMELDVTVPSVGTWMVKAEYSGAWHLDAGEGSGAAGIEITEDPLGATGGPNSTINWRGGIGVGSDDGGLGTIHMVAYDFSPTAGDVYRAKVAFDHSGSPGAVYGSLVPIAGRSIHGELNIWVLPYGS